MDFFHFITFFLCIPRYGPHFEDVQRVGQATNLTVQAGSSIHLNCRISLLQDKTVSATHTATHLHSKFDSVLGTQELYALLLLHLKTYTLTIVHQWVA